MRQELLTAEELKSKPREQGIEHLDEIKITHMEENGEISILRRDQQKSNQSSGKQEYFLCSVVEPADL
jgi:uncharacterized membrane protein YcaP (DUF421 family)